MIRRIQINADQWSAIVEVDLCGRCPYYSEWWKLRLWQHPRTLTVHRVGRGGTACGVPIPKDLPDVSLRFEP